MARNGKIARLPKWLRDTLNIKLRNGESGVAVVAWLKCLWEENEVVSDAVGEEPVNEQNLSAWRQGGYRDWERRQEAAELVHGLAEHAQDLKQEADGQEVSDRLSTALTGELARVAEAMLAETTNPRERWDLLKEMLRELTRVRQMDHRASKLAREQADWEQAREQAEARQAGPDPVEAMEELQRKKFLGTLCAAGMANKRGATESDRVVAAAMADSVFGLPLGTIKLSAAKPVAVEPVAPDGDKGESSKIKENQGESEALMEEGSAPDEAQAAEDSGIEDPPSSDYGVAGGEEEEEGAGAPIVNLAPDVPQEVWGRQLAADGTPLPPGVHWQFERHPIQAGVPAKMVLVNASGEEVGQDGQPILEKCGVRSAECGMEAEAGADDGGIENAKRDAAEAALDEAGSSKIKENQGEENQGEPEAPPGLPPAAFSTSAELPGDGTLTQAEEPPEEWEDGGWMKQRPNKGGSLPQYPG